MGANCMGTPCRTLIRIFEILSYKDLLISLQHSKNNELTFDDICMSSQMKRLL